MVLKPRQAEEQTYDTNKIIPAPEENSTENNTIPLNIKNFIYKGTKIRNVGWVAGVVVYTGPETKIQLNGAATKSKISKLERLMHKLIIVMFILQVMFSVMTSVGQIILNQVNSSDFDRYFSGA